MLWSPNCQLLYPFENQANDYSGNARHGTLGGTPPCTYATKPNGGRCLYFPGTGYVTTPSFGLSGTVVVFAADVRCKYGADLIQLLLGDYGESNTVGYLICFQHGPDYNLYWKYADGVASRFSIAVGYFAPYNDAWLHLAIVCDYTNKKCYLFRKGTLFYVDASLSGTPVFPSTAREKYIGAYNTKVYYLTDGYLKNVYLGTLASCPPVAELTANANRLMLGMNPIWSV